MGGDVLHKVFWPPPSGIPIFCRVHPYRIANFLGPPTPKISFTFLCRFPVTKSKKMQLDVEVSPPAIGAKMSNLQVHKFLKIITYKAWLLGLTTHIAENADAFGQILMFDIKTGWGLKNVHSVIFSSHSRLVLQ